MSKSELEQELAFQLTAAKLPEPIREATIVPDRRFRFDFAWLDKRLVVEVDGGTWSGGRHVTGAGYARDCEKHNLAVAAGWRVLRFTGEMVRDGRALRAIEEVLSERGCRDKEAGDD